MSEITVRLAYKEDLKAMHRVEMSSFSMPWSFDAFVENFYNVFSVYVLAEDENGEVVGFGGMQSIFEEAHIMNIAVLKEFRRRGIAEKMLSLMKTEAKARKAEKMFLEVRAGNTPAKELYRKHGFNEIAVRKGYYSDNGEDALIMEAEI